MDRHLFHSGMGKISVCLAALSLSLLCIQSSFALSTIELQVDYQPEAKNLQFIQLKNRQLDAIGNINAIMQDGDGFLWVGGEQGLVRYDGYQFHPYRSDPKREDSLSHNHIRELAVDANGELWAATVEHVSHFEADYDRFRRYSVFEEGSSLGKHKYTSGLVFDDAGRLWVTSIGAFSSLSESRTEFERSILLTDSRMVLERDFSEDDAHLVIENPIGIFKSRDGSIWMSCLDYEIFFVGLCEYDANGSKSFKIHKPENESWKKIWLDRVVEDEDGNIWFSSPDGGVYRYDRKKQIYAEIIYIDQEKKRIPIHRTHEMYFDREGNLWVATDFNGLFRINHEKLTVERYSARDGDSSSLHSSKIRSIYQDKQGVLWFGGFPSGVSKINPYASSLQTYGSNKFEVNSLSHKDVLSIAENKRGDLWVGTENGLNLIERKSGQIKRFVYDANSTENILNASAVLKTYVDSNDTLWLGYWDGGIGKYDKSNGSIKHYLPDANDKNSIGNQHIFEIYEDSSGIFWIGSYAGLDRFDPKLETFTQFYTEDLDPTTIIHGPVRTVYEDRKNRLWVGTDNGLTLMNRSTGKFTRFVHNEEDKRSLGAGRVYSIFEDSTGSLWFAMFGGGVSRLIENTDDIARSKYSSITTEDGLSDNYVVSILEDDSGDLWFSTSYGLSRYNTKTKSFKNYTREHGLPGNVFRSQAKVKTAAGELVLGGENGLVIIKPEALFENTQAPQIAINDFKLFNRSVSNLQAGSPLSKSILKADLIQLNYNQNFFSFDFVALSHISPQLNQYRFQLKGVDKGWIDAGHSRSASYTNLDPGRYTFTVIGANSEGVWNNKGRSIDIIVHPPWWRTWWAHMTYVFLFVLLIFSLIYVQIRKRQLAEEQNRILEEKVKTRTAQLQRKKDDIQTMLTHIRQGLFTIKEDGTIHPEYSQHLETIFNTEDIVGKDYMSLLFANSDIGEDQLNQIDSTLYLCLNYDEYNFLLNSHHLPSEIEKTIDGTKKTLHLEWNPIVEDTILVRLMVTVRDVTLVKSAEQAIAKKKQELEMIEQLVAIPFGRYDEIEQSFHELLEDSQSNLEALSEEDEGETAAIFRNIHTIKGNARIYKCEYICDLAHSFEKNLGTLSAQDSLEDRRLILGEGIARLAFIIAEYSRIYHDVLNRGNAMCLPRGGLWIDTPSVKKILRATTVDKVHTIIENAQALPFSALTEDIVESISSIAEQLNKVSPKVTVNASGFKIKKEASAAIKNSLSHVLRNAIDHGIEAEAERLSKGKDAQGQINISAKLDKEYLTISISDDGRGYNKNRLFKKGVELGAWPEDAAVADIDILEIVFCSGVTTKDEATEISGRGVGMDAVKIFIEELGGSVHFDIEGSEEEGFLRTRLNLCVPPQCCVDA